MENEDRMLCERCKGGDISAFDELMDKYGGRVYNFAYRMAGNYDDANDVAQEAFIRVYQSIRRFRGECSFSTWLYRIVTHVYLDGLRRRKRREEVLADDSAVEGWVSGDDPQRSLEMKERQMVVQRAIGSLPEQHRAVIVLYDLEGFSYDEIAEILRISVGTVKSRLNRARLALKEKLRGDLELFGF